SGPAVSRGSGPDAARGRLRGASGFRDRSAYPRRAGDAPPRDREGRAAPPRRGVLQDPPVGLRREDVPSARGHGTASRDHAGARYGRTRVLGRGGASRSVSRAIPKRAGHADKRDSRRHPARAAGTRRPPSPPTPRRRNAAGAAAAAGAAPPPPHRANRPRAFPKRLLDP